MRGGNRGGGTTVRKVELSEKAAQELRRRATITGERYRKEEADAAASEVIELLADGRLFILSADVHAALPWIEEARRMCPDETAQRGLDQLIAALWVVGRA